MKSYFNIVIATVLAIVTCFVGSMSACAEVSNSEEPVAAYVATSNSSNDLSINVESSFKKYTVYAKKAKVKAYKKASSSSKVVKTYYKGTKFTVTAVSGNWRKIGKDKWINKNDLTQKDPMGKYKGVKLLYYSTYNVTKNKLTRSKGVVYYNGHKETWYSQKVLPGSGLKIPGRHVAKDGTIRDADGYIVIACNYIKKGAKMMTSLGPGKCYDNGSMSGKWIDIYTNW